MVLLSVNVDHVATLRQSRGTAYPDPVVAAQICELAGADGITIHLREDRRHIQERDLKLMRDLIQIRLNLEMANTEEMLNIALNYKPDIVTLVPEKRAELTTEGGLDVNAMKESLKKSIELFRAEDIPVSLFIEPDKAAVDASKEVGADIVELHTGSYAEKSDKRSKEKELSRIVDASAYASEIGLKVAAGHGLTDRNLGPIAAIKEMEELNIGHALVSMAVFVGMEEAVKLYQTAILRAQKLIN